MLTVQENGIAQCRCRLRHHYIALVKNPLLWRKTQEINVTDWEKHTNYSSGYRTCDHQISWFWDLIRALPDNERRLVLLFVTGMTAPPLGGFASLTTSGGDLMPFTIMRVECLKTESPLPTAATCFNLLKLPAYPNREMLNEKVLTGIRFGSHGFNFA